MKFKALGFAVLAIATMVSIPAAAHHSIAMFDAGKTMTLEGTVKLFEWTNPHSWITLTVTDANGQSVDWPIELGSPGGLARQGWVPKTLTPGMKVKVVIHPLREGIGGQFLSVTLPDGKQLGDPGAGSQPAGGESPQG